MIRVTRINGDAIVLNSDLIETIEATPDTVISLTTGRKILVRESVPQIVRLITIYQRAILAGMRPGVRRHPHAVKGSLGGQL